MPTVVVERKFNLPAGKLWGLLGDFGNLSWAPGHHRVELVGEGVGMIRRIFMHDVPFPLEEQLRSHDPKKMQFTYHFPNGIPFPMTNYIAGAKVIPTGSESCQVKWHATADASDISEEEAADMMHDLYTQLLNWVADHLGVH